MNETVIAWIRTESLSLKWTPWAGFLTLHAALNRTADTAKYLISLDELWAS